MKITEAELAGALNMMILPAGDFTLIDPPRLPQPPGPDGPYGPPQALVQFETGKAALIFGGARIAAGVFGVIRNLRAEAARWVTGALYQSVVTARPLNDDLTTGLPHEIVSVYRREEDGWWLYGCNERVPDGRIDTSGFRRLIPEGDPA